MHHLNLENVTLIGIDCLDIDRLEFAARVSCKRIRFNSVKLLTSIPNTFDNTVEIRPVLSREHYSAFVMKELYKYVDTKMALVIQWDGFVLEPGAWREEFLQYDYVGAPWHTSDEYKVGNGGFSLRSRALMKKLALDPLIQRSHPEDVMTCKSYGAYLRQAGFTFAPPLVAGKFSIDGGKWGGQFGFHKADISSWNIRGFLDCSKDGKYLSIFSHVFGNDAANYRQIRPGTLQIGDPGST